MTHTCFIDVRHRYCFHEFYCISSINRKKTYFTLKVPRRGNVSAGANRKIDGRDVFDRFEKPVVNQSDVFEKTLSVIVSKRKRSNATRIEMKKCCEYNGQSRWQHAVMDLTGKIRGINAFQIHLQPFWHNSRGTRTSLFQLCITSRTRGNFAECRTNCPVFVFFFFFY